MKRLERLGGRTYYIEDLSEVEAEIYGKPHGCGQEEKEVKKDETEKRKCKS